MVVAPTPRRRSVEDRRLPWMLAVALLLLVLVVLLVHDGQRSSSSGLQGSGRAASETRAVSPFQRVELAGSSNVVVSAGLARSVMVTADDNLIDRVTTRVRAGTLVVGSVGSYSSRVPMVVNVTVPSLRALTLSGSGIVSAAGLDAHRLKIALSGSGLVRASGTVDSLDVSLDGSGDAQLNALRARDARAVVTGSGRILVHATRRLDASVPGTGVIMYQGHPSHVTRTVTGTGAVVP